MVLRLKTWEPSKELGFVSLECDVIGCGNAALWGGFFVFGGALPKPDFDGLALVL